MFRPFRLFFRSSPFALVAAILSAVPASAHAKAEPAPHAVVPSPERVALARRWLIETGALATLNANIRTSLIPVMTTRIMAKLADSYSTELDAALQRALAEELNSRDYLTAAAGVYAMIFDEHELHEMLSFAETTTGRKMAREASAIQFVLLEQQGALLIGFEDEVIARLCKTKPGACAHLHVEETTTTKTQVIN